jgi:NAD(P)-dependent dehydrogenase (short-subunit alcohol dehydrogenase family)
MEKIALITGATEGIGKETARGLLRKGFKVVLHGRNKEKLQQTIIELSQEVSQPDVAYIIADFSDLQSVQRMVQEFTATYSRLDILINNAAAMFTNRHLSKDGNEMMLQINYFALVVLTEGLLALIEATPNSRIVNLSSVGYKMAKPNWSDFNFEKSYVMQRDYFNTKLYVLYYTLDLADRLASKHIPVNAVHPGGVRTQLARDFKGVMKILFAIMMPVFFISPAKGAATSIFVATDSNIGQTSGNYFVKSKPEKLLPIATDLSNRKKLRELTNKILKMNTLT